ncbi:M20 family metallopeptidase [Leucobacter sp. NPDC015123]|uniref:M20 family metallopeptidase n=1 Tax=Leucobacter sp. NPDC015123 TaxID=3364129 RepID=UPI0036F4ADD5
MNFSPRERAALNLLDIDAITADTCDLIRGRGENPGETERDTVLRLAAICARIGAEVTLQEVEPGRENLRATLGPADGPAILFLGHSDVVPAGEGWSGDPFEPRIAGGRIIGRGSTDMKGGLAAVLAAMAAVSEVAPDLRLELLCTVDEEDRALGVLAALAAETPREYLACIVAEPTDLDVVIGCRGASNLVVEVTGASAHAGRPEDGASSIYAAARIVELVRDRHAVLAAGERDKLLGTGTWNVGTIEGGSGTSMVPRVTTLTLDRRTMPGEDPETILAELLGAARIDLAESGIANAERFCVTGTVDMEMPGFRTDTDSPIVQIASQALRELGTSGRQTGWTAACEGGFIARHHGTSTIILGPGDITGQAHQPDENVEISQLATAAQAYVLTALRLAGAAQPTKQHQPHSSGSA